MTTRPRKAVRPGRLHRNGSIGFVAVPENQMVFVVAPNGVVSCFVVRTGKLRKFLAAHVRFEAIRVEDWATPLVPGPLVNPRWAITEEVANQVGVST